MASQCWALGGPIPSNCPTYLLPSGQVDDGQFLNPLMTSGRRLVQLGPGTFRLRQSLQLAQLGIQLKGAGTEATVLLVDDSVGNIGDAITFMTSATDCRVSDLTITAPTARTAGNAIRTLGAGNLTIAGSIDCFNRVDNVNLRNQFNGLVYEDGVGALPCWFTIAKDMRMVDLATGGVGIWVKSSGGQNFFRDIEMYGNPAAVDAARYMAGVRVQKCNDSLFSNVVSVYGQHGLLIDPGAGQFVNATWFMACDFDSTTQAAVRIQAGAAIPFHIHFTNLWASASNGAVNAVELVGVQSISFVQGHMPLSARGFRIDGCRDIDIQDCHIYDNAVGGVHITGSSRDVSVQGNRFYNGSGTAPPEGVRIDAGCDWYKVRDNTGRITAPLSGAPGTPLVEPTPGANRDVGGNLW